MDEKYTGYAGRPAARRRVLQAVCLIKRDEAVDYMFLFLDMLKAEKVSYSTVQYFRNMKKRSRL